MPGVQRRKPAGDTRKRVNECNRDISSIENAMVSNLVYEATHDFFDSCTSHIEAFDGSDG